VASCATLAERLRSSHFAPLPVQDPEVLTDRERRWAESAASGDRAQFAALLAAQGLDARAARNSVREVRVSNPQRLPAWAGAFLQLLDGADFKARRTPPATGCASDRYSFAGAFVPFAGVAERALDLMLKDHPVPVAPAARRQMVDHLVARWLTASQAAFTLECRLRQEMQAAPRPPDGATSRGTGGAPSAAGNPWELSLDSAAEWIDLLGHHPLVLRLIGTAYQHWNVALAELLARLAADRETLARLLGGRRPDQVAACELGAGDSHRGGRSVAILTFEDGRQVVYKPRDVRPEAAFNAYLRRANQLAGDLPLRAYEVVVRAEYGWVEFVRASATRAVGSAPAFYRRVGRLLRLLQLLGAHDLHWQNAILSDEQLVILDLEGLLAAPPTQPSAGPGAAGLRHLRNSPLATWVLPPVWSFGPYGTRPLDTSVLTAGGTGPTATRRLSAQVDDGGLPTLIASRLRQQIGARQPMADGKIASPHQHAEDILEGYRDMNRLIRAHGPDLRAAADLADATVRFVPRNTAFYAGLLQMSLSPAYLQSGVDRDLCLHRLFQACRDPLESAARIVRAEVQALRDLDIPYCRHPAGRDCLILDDGTEVGGYLEDVPLNMLDSRWSGFEGEELEEQLDLVRSSLDASTGAPISRHRDRSGPLRGVGTDECIESAVAIGDLILAQARGEDDGAVSFLGLHYVAVHDVSEVALLRPDLLSGVGGLAIVLADLFTVTGKGRFRAAAARLAATVHSALAATVGELAASCRRARSRGEPLLCGGLVGLGSLLYSLRRCRTVLGDAPLPEPAVTAQDVTVLAGQVPEDLICGLAGLLLALLAAPGGVGSQAAANECGEALVQRRRRGESRAASLYPPAATLLRGLPDIDTGVAFALLRLGTVTGTMPAEVSPADFTGAAATPGNLLARLRAREWSGDTHVGALVRRHLAALDRASSSLDLLDGLELALEAAWAFDDRRLRSHALSIAGELQNRHRESGSWFPDRLAADRHCLSAITGLGALAHALIRLDSARPTRSLRLLD
jgi:type 2 lantibiotic biosynthesis protein LanM